MAQRTMNIGNITVVVKHVGEGAPAWDRQGDPHFEYEVTVKGPGGARYKSKAWGSSHDYEQNKLDWMGMAEAVLNDLYSAYTDPDEFFTIVIGEAEGREAYERGKDAEKVVKAAQKFGQSIVPAYESVREAEETGQYWRLWEPEE